MDAVVKGQVLVKSDKDPLPATVHAAAERLVTSLLEAEPVAAYHRAKECLDGDQEALTLLKRLVTAQVELRSNQSGGHITQTEIDRLRALEHEARNNQLIVDYVTTQQIASAYLANVNQEISQLLGIDFNALASSGYC